MPLSLLSNSLLLQERPNGDSATFDLDAVLANHNGAFLLGGSHFSTSATNVRLRGAILYATLATHAHGKMIQHDAAIDLEACCIVRSDGLFAPFALVDPALNTKDTHAIRTALMDGRRSRLGFLPPSKTDLANPWLEINVLEALTLHSLARAERTLLHVLPSSSALSTIPRLLSGLLEGDKRKLAADPAIDPRTVFVRNYARYIREAPGVRPRDWASVFETAYTIIDELLRALRSGFPFEVEKYLRLAQRHLNEAVKLRRTAIRLDPEERRARRRTRFNRRLEHVVEMLDRATLPPTPPPSRRTSIDDDQEDPFADVL